MAWLAFKTQLAVVFITQKQLKWQLLVQHIRRYIISVCFTAFLIGDESRIVTCGFFVDQK